MENTILKDIHHSARSLARKPGFALAAILTLALGIGANTAIFGTVNALLLHPFTFPHLDRLVLFDERGENDNSSDNRFASADFVQLQHESPAAFEQFAGTRFQDLNLTGIGDPQPVEGFAVSANFFDVVGVRAAQGRTFVAGEDEPGRDQAAILSDRFWKERFGSDPRLVGKTIRLNGRACTVVGIMPEDFTYPLGAQLWIPLALQTSEKTDRALHSFRVVARLKEGLSLAQAREQLRAFEERLAKEFPDSNAGRTAHLIALRDEQFGFTAPMFLLLQIAAGFVLLLACVNVASLFLARIVERQKEMAIRTALGASQRRLTRLFVTESLLLFFLAAFVAVLAASWGAEVIRSSLPADYVRWIAGWSRIRVDASVLAFTLLITVLVGVLFGVVTAFQGARIDLAHSLKEAGSRATPSRGRARLLGALVVGEVILAMVLLTGAGLTMKGFLHLVNTFQGFEPAGVLKLTLTLTESRYPDNPKVVQFYTDILRGIQSLPDVQMAATVRNHPASNVDNPIVTFTMEGRAPFRSNEKPAADFQTASSDYFRTLRIPLREGRYFTDTDLKDAPRVALISQSMAEHYWPKQDPVGRRLKLETQETAAPWATIVGVVGDVKQNWWNPKPRPTIYLPFQQAPRRDMDLLIRTASDPAQIVPALKSLVQHMDPDLPLKEMQTLDKAISESVSPVRIIGILMLVFGVVALALSAVGVFGIVAHGVAQRTHEFGVRIAMGAQPRDVRRLVLGQALKLSAIGLLIAFPLALAMSYAMSAYLFGLVSLNMGVLASFAAVLLLVATAAGYIPAVRATRVDPILALRQE